MDKTLEGKVADTVLQRVREVEIGGRTYAVAPPTVATLILVSEAISQLPARALDPANVVGESLGMARDCRPLGDVAAILILGARNCAPVPARYERRRAAGIAGLLGRTVEVLASPSRDPVNELSARILGEFSPGALHMLIASLLQQMDLGDFFALTTFLSETNILRQTKVVTEATASGR